MTDKLKNIIAVATEVANARRGDAWSSDSYWSATTDLSAMRHLEEALDFFSIADFDKELNQIKADAVMDNARNIAGAYCAGFIDNHPTTYDIYRTAQNYVKDNYGIDTEVWDDEHAKQSREDTYKKLETEKYQCQTLEVQHAWTNARLLAGIGAAIICIKQGEDADAFDWLINSYDGCDVSLDGFEDPQAFADQFVIEQWSLDIASLKEQDAQL